MEIDYHLSKEPVDRLRKSCNKEVSIDNVKRDYCMLLDFVNSAIDVLNDFSNTDGECIDIIVRNYKKTFVK